VSRELLQLAADTIEAMWDRRAGGKLNIDAASSSFIHRAQLTLAALRAALAQPETQPVNQQIESINAVFDAWRNGEDASMTLGLATPQAQPAPAVPDDMAVLIQRTREAAHWQLIEGNGDDETHRALIAAADALERLSAAPAVPDLIPPDALFVCGQMGADVVRVRVEDAAPAVNCEWTNCPRRVGDVCCNDRPAAPAVPADHWKSAVLDRLAILCLDAPIGEPPASILNRVIETEVMIALDPAVSEAAQALIDKGAAAPAVREPHEPYLCIKPACGPDCSGCNCAISPQDMRDYAVRYAILRNAPIDAIRAGGVFAGKTPDNVVINGEHLDAAVDALRGITGDSK